ncbi:MAG: hypothetical protein EOP42_20405 [Sphingobacteriaceae bacterium]|nr:MAG: hypothetical protein EOP42_20405 [Sphingobacteriaceae bacterium]
MKLRNIVKFALPLIVLGVACNQAKIEDNNTDQFTSGTYNFVFDESISPILDQELYVFKSLYPLAKPNIIYQPENKILNLVLNNQARFAVMSRDLHRDEVNLLTNRGLAVKSSKEVIRYVAEHDGAIGFISYSWLIEPDKDYEAVAKNIKIVGIKNENLKGDMSDYFKPSQSTLALKQYPLTRSVYVVDCTGKIGLGAGFASFLQSERGQKIVLRSGLLPDSLPTREISIKTEM